MKTYYHVNHNGRYTLTLEDTGRMRDDSHPRVRYTLVKGTGKQRETIFAGDDFGASPLHDPESRESAASLLTFLTLMPGDTDSEYFDNYTERQMDFARSEAEALYFWQEKLNPEAYR